MVTMIWPSIPPIFTLWCRLLMSIFCTFVQSACQLPQLVLHILDGSLSNLHLWLLCTHQLNEHFFLGKLLLSRWLHPVLCLDMKSKWCLGMSLWFLTTGLISSPSKIWTVLPSRIIGVGLGVVLIPVVIANEVGGLNMNWTLLPWIYFHRNHRIGIVLLGHGESWVYMLCIYLLNAAIWVNKALKASN